MNKKHSSIDKLALFKTMFWIMFCVVVIAFTILFITERARVNGDVRSSGAIIDGNQYKSINDIKNAIANGQITSAQDLASAYKQMYEWAKYPLIDFSLMVSFFANFKTPPTDPATTWSVRSTAVDMAYSYLFITAMIALVALVFQILMSIEMLIQRHKEVKYDLSTKYPNNFLSYKMFNVKMFMDFITNLAIVFAFFNFLSTLIVIGYWIFLYSVQLIIKLISKKQINLSDSFGSNKHDFWYLIFVMLFQNLYTMLKSIFLSKFGVNLDLIFQIILPIGTITLIVGLFIKNLLSSKVNSVLSAIKNIDGKVTSFRAFFYTNKEESLNDYNFVSILPPLIKNPLIKGNMDHKRANNLMLELDETITFINTKYQKKQRQYMLYVLFNQVGSIDEINEIKTNTNKLIK